MSKTTFIGILVAVVAFFTTAYFLEGPRSTPEELDAKITAHIKTELETAKKGDAVVLRDGRVLPVFGVINNAIGLKDGRDVIWDTKDNTAHKVERVMKHNDMYFRDITARFWDQYVGLEVPTTQPAESQPAS